MLKTLIAVIGLVGLWLLMSGLYLPLVLAFGAISVLITIFFVNRMDHVDGEGLHYTFNLIELIKYFFWLLVEIAKSNWSVAKIIISGKEPEHHKLVRTPSTQTTDMAKVIYANSITLTPGTITVEIEPGTMLVHALSFGDGDMEALADMDARVTVVETGGQN